MREETVSSPANAAIRRWTRVRPWRVPWQRALLLALPVALLCLEPVWFYSGPNRDSWLYYGFFQNGLHYLERFQDLYYASRPGVFVPGFVLHHLLPVEPANLALRLVLWWTAVLSLHGVVASLFGKRPALVTALAFGCHPYALHAFGWNYTDGFGIAYSLVATWAGTLAATSPHWRRLSFVTGAAGMALLATNVFYVAYWPFLALHVHAVRRARGGAAGRSLLLHAVAGGSALFAILALVNRIVAGRWFFLHSSFGFLAGRLGATNPFRDDTYSWLRSAAWLVFPAVVLAGAVGLLWRSRTDDGLRRDSLLLWSQRGLLVLACVLTLFQVFGNTAVLQHYYYSSMLLPATFLALAGQLRDPLARLSGPRFAVLAAAATALLIAAATLPPALLDERTARTAFPSLLAAVAAMLALRAPWRAFARALGFVALLAAAQYLQRDDGDLFWHLARLGGDRDSRGLFLQMAAAVEAVEAFDPLHTTRLWYDRDESAGHEIDAIAAAHLLCPRMINLSFPDIEGGRMCDGSMLAPGVPVVVLSTDARAEELAVEAIASVGLASRRVGSRVVTGPIPGLTLTFLRIEAPAGP